MSQSENKMSRYEHVKEILDTIQGEKQPNYQGYHAFWRLPLAQFLTVELYGQRMIAPDIDGESISVSTDAHCNHCEPAPTMPTAPTEKRSAQSGLIKGLRGEAPFDGTVFPPLLWEATRRATESEINTIAAWIDAGCPAEDLDEGKRQAEVDMTQNKLAKLAHGIEKHQPTDRHHNAVRRDVSGLLVRKEISTLNSTELATFRAAIAEMYKLNQYILDERGFHFWAQIHANSCQHGWEQFLPWHRGYLYYFEQQLQDIDPNITLPYWDWVQYSRENRTTDQTEQLDMGVIPEAYRCFLDEQGLEQLLALHDADQKPLFDENDRANLEQTLGHTYNSGLRFLKAAGISYGVERFTDLVNRVDYRWAPKIHALYAQLQHINPLWHPNRYPGSIGSATHYPTPENIEEILAVQSFAGFGSGPSYDHHFGALEEIHNGMHNFAGGLNPFFQKDGNIQSEQDPKYGDMVDNRVTAFDPIFWAHHCNVDRLWAVWQARNPGVNPEELDGILPPWSLAVRDMLSTKKLGYEYVKESIHFETNAERPMVRFNSTKAGVKPGVLDTFRRAEVRLHRVQYAAQNAYIRVLLSDGTNPADDAISGGRFDGTATTFFGTCYGGPGHCDVPAPRNRRFDQRPLPHHEPRNFRINVTEAVQRLLTQGANDISVHLVPVDLDDTPATNALYLDGVSLNFFD